MIAAPSTTRRLPPGPRRPLILPSLLGRGRDPLVRFTSLARDYGDISTFRVLGERIILLNHPDFIREVLVTQSKRFAKGRALERARSVLGTGLLTSEGNFHLRQRRLIQPAFHQQRIAAFADVMTSHATRLTAGWRDGEPRDLAVDMMRLTLGIVGQTLLGADVGGEAAQVRDALNTVMHSFPLLMLPFSGFLQKLPLPAMKRLRAARADLDRIIYQLIVTRRADGSDHGDLLSMLLAAQDPESDDPESGMSDEQVRDELMTIFLAGHETTANALAWTWYLLAKHPDSEARLRAEEVGVKCRWKRGRRRNQLPMSLVLCVVALSRTKWTFRPFGTRASMVSKKARNSALRWRGWQEPMTVPAFTSRAAKRSSVPRRL